MSRRSTRPEPLKAKHWDPKVYFFLHPSAPQERRRRLPQLLGHLRHRHQRNHIILHLNHATRLHPRRPAPGDFTGHLGEHVTRIIKVHEPIAAVPQGPAGVQVLDGVPVHHYDVREARVCEACLPDVPIAHAAREPESGQRLLAGTGAVCAFVPWALALLATWRFSQ